VVRALFVKIYQSFGDGAGSVFMKRTPEPEGEQCHFHDGSSALL